MSQQVSSLKRLKLQLKRVYSRSLILSCCFAEFSFGWMWFRAILMLQIFFLKLWSIEWNQFLNETRHAACGIIITLSLQGHAKAIMLVEFRLLQFFSSMYLITTLVTFLAVWLILVGSQGTHMLYMAHYLMGPPRFCLRAPLLIQTRDAIGKWWRDCEWISSTAHRLQ